MNPKTEEEWAEYLRLKPDAEVLVFKNDRAGGASQKAATTVWLEREKKIRDEEFQRLEELAKLKQTREAEHTLWTYWRLANWSERAGIMMAFILVFVIGCLCAKVGFVVRFIDLIREVKP